MSTIHLRALIAGLAVLISQSVSAFNEGVTFTDGVLPVQVHIGSITPAPTCVLASIADYADAEFVGVVANPAANVEIGTKVIYLKSPCDTSAETELWFTVARSKPKVTP